LYRLSSKIRVSNAVNHFVETACLPRLSVFHRICQTEGNHMLRFILSAIALAGALETVSPACADPLAAMAAEPAQAAATAAAQPAPPAPASSSSSNATAAASIGQDKDIAPTGFGWG
jgi:hypothetical protein